MMKARILPAAGVSVLIVIAILLWVKGLEDYWEAARLDRESARMAESISARQEAGRYNGFDVENAIIPAEEILAGGPLRDGIPSIDNPRFTAPEKADFLKEDDRVISLTHEGETRAYPLRILVWHEIVNDRLGDLAVSVTYCPLCGTAMVFDREVQGKEFEFGVSGLLYQSDVLMYDRQTESLWSQLGMKAVSGPMVKTPLEWLPSEHLTWKRWKEKYPEGQVLSTNTGHRRNYLGSPYEGYEQSPNTMVPVTMSRKDLPKKTWVLGVICNGQAKAYPIEQLSAGEGVEDEIAGVAVEVRYDPETHRPTVRRQSDQQPLPYTLAYWFAWQAFHPDTALWQSGE